MPDRGPFNTQPADTARVKQGAPGKRERAINPAPVKQGQDDQPVDVPDLLEVERRGGLLSPEGRGVVKGVPHGENLLEEEGVFAMEHAFLPGAERLRAATRRALGR